MRGVTTTNFPVPLAGTRDWRVPLARRVVLGLGWVAFACGVAAGVTGLVMGIALAWAAPALAAFIALGSVVVVPEPRPASVPRRRRRKLRPESIELPGLWAPRARRAVSVDLLAAGRCAVRSPAGSVIAYETHLRRP